MKSPAPIRAISFDAVGTLLFPEPSPFAVYATMASDNGLSLSSSTIRERFLRAFQHEEAVDRAAGWATSEAHEFERWRTIVHRTLEGVRDPEACFQRLWNHYARPDAWRVNPEAAEVLQAFADRGFTLGMASNFDRRLREVMAGHAVLRPLRDRILISSEVGHRKPARSFFQEVARSLGCEPARILHVGDSRDNDYAGALDAGFQAVLLVDESVLTPSKSEIRSLRELLSWEGDNGSAVIRK